MNLLSIKTTGIRDHRFPWIPNPDRDAMIFVYLPQFNQFGGDLVLNYSSLA